MMAPPVCRRVTGGVDTHGDVHVAAALDSTTGRPFGTASFSTATSGYAALLGGASATSTGLASSRPAATEPG